MLFFIIIFSDTVFSPKRLEDMIKEKQANKGKNGTNNSFENIGTPGSSNSETREESKKESEKNPEVKEEIDDGEVPDNPPVAHSSPLDEVKSSPLPAVSVGSIKGKLCRSHAVICHPYVIFLVIVL